MGMLRTSRVVLLAVAVAAAVALGACAQKEEPKPTPKVQPPAIGEAGKLRAGVDLSTPPFGGVDQTQKAGLDVDVAAAVAEKLGLAVTYVDVAPSEAATALADGSVDVVLSVSVSDADLTRLTPAGIYAVDGPVAFVAVDGTASVEPSMTLQTLPVVKVAAQKESQAFWRVGSEYGDESVEGFESLREALEAVDRGENPVAVGDAFVGAYISRDFPRIKVAGQIGPAASLAAAVRTENSTMADAVRSALDELAADGVLDSIRTKWVGALPPLESPDASSTTQ